METVTTHNNYLLKLVPGEEIVDSLRIFSKQESLSSGIITGIGAVKDPKLGYFDKEAQEYHANQLNGDFELVNLQGNLAVQEGEKKIHLHCSVADEENNLFGGHLFKAEIAVTGEIYIKTLNKKINRAKGVFGLDLLDLR